MHKTFIKTIMAVSLITGVLVLSPMQASAQCEQKSNTATNILTYGGAATGGFLGFLTAAACATAAVGLMPFTAGTSLAIAPACIGTVGVATLTGTAVGAWGGSEIGHVIDTECDDE